MKTVGVVRDKRFRRHLAPSHPEQPARLDYIDQALLEAGLLEKLVNIPARPAEPEDILRVHKKKVFDLLESTRGRATGFFDTDTYFCGESADTALLAAGGTIAAAEAIVRGDVDRAIALVRPPGHHATSLRSMGFCLYNNIAIATRYIQHHFDIERVAIVDFDVHHGNGTQDIFYEDPSVFYYSIHQQGVFPGSGLVGETGGGAGEGKTLNVPVDSGMPRTNFVEEFRSSLDPVFAFDPQFLMVSAGFDAHRRDPLASMELEADDFYTITRIILQRCQQRQMYGVLSCLEGGYNLLALGECVARHVQALLED